MNKVWLIAAGFLLAFTGLYFFTFNHDPNKNTIYNSASYDEYRNLNVVEGILQTGLPTLLGLNYWQHPPLPFYLDAAISFLTNLSPHQASAFLMPILGGATIALIYLLAWQVFENQEDAAASALFAGVLPYTWLGFDVFLNDPFSLFFTVLSFLLLAVYLENPKAKYALMLGAALALGLLSKITFAPTLAVVLLVLYLEWSKDKSKLKAPALACTSFLLVSAPYYAYRILNTSQGILGLFGDSSTFLTTSGLGPYNEVTTLPKLLSNLGLFYPLLLIPLVLLGAALIIKAPERKKKLLAILAGFALLFLVVSTVSAFKDLRYYIPILPSLAILTVYGLTALNNSLVKRAALFLAIVYLAATSYSLASAQGSWNSQTPLVSYLSSLNDSGGVILTNGNYMELAYTVGLAGIHADDFTAPSDLIKYNAKYLLNCSGLQTNSLIPLKTFDGCQLDEVNPSFFQDTFKVTLKNQDGQPINGALVSIPGAQWVSRSNAAGIALLPGGIAGPAIIEALCYSPLRIQELQANYTMQETSCIQNGLSEYRY